MTRVERFEHRERLGRLSATLDWWLLSSRLRRWQSLAEKPHRRAERARLERRIARTLQQSGRPYGLDGRVYSATKSGFLSVREVWNASGPWMDWTI